MNRLSEKQSKLVTALATTAIATAVACAVVWAKPGSRFVWIACPVAMLLAMALILLNRNKGPVAYCATHALYRSGIFVGFWELDTSGNIIVVALFFAVGLGLEDLAEFYFREGRAPRERLPDAGRESTSSRGAELTD